MNTENNTTNIPVTGPQATPKSSALDKKARDIIGLPVVTFNRGSKIADVEDMILDPARPQVLALVLENSSFMRSARIVPFGYISSIGRDAVIVPDGKAVVDLNRIKDKTLRDLYNDQTVRGLRVLSEDGRRLGTVADMLIDTKTGEIKGYYMSIGRVLDVTQGSRFIPASNVLSVGQRVIYVSPTTADELEQQVGGWAGSLDQAGGGLREAGSRANEQLVNLGDKLREAGGKWNEQLGQLGTQVRDQLPAQSLALIVGRTAHRTVTAPDGTVIVNEGDTITQEQVDQARSTGRFTNLALAAGTGPVQQHVSNFNTEASDTWQRTRSEARTLWEQITGGHSATADVADERIMQRRIKNALGRPANRVILDQDDNIILNTGDIITNRAVENARQAGVLDILVDSVYNEKPTLSLSDLKAPKSGDASLENITSGSGGGTGSRQVAAARPTSAGPVDTIDPLKDTTRTGAQAATIDTTPAEDNPR